MKRVKEEGSRLTQIGGEEGLQRKEANRRET